VVVIYSIARMNLNYTVFSHLTIQMIVNFVMLLCCLVKMVRGMIELLRINSSCMIEVHFLSEFGALVCTVLTGFEGKQVLNE
jgi:hypothetical protein